MNRWSFIKRFGRVNFEEFMRFADQFCKAVDSCYESPSKITVTFYAELPYSITTIRPPLNELVAERNKERELAKVVGLENATRELFDRAINVQLDIRPENAGQAPEYTFGQLECKGLLNRHLVFYVQPEEVGNPVRALFLGEQRPKLRFAIGDGYEHCHSVSRS